MATWREARTAKTNRQVRERRRYRAEDLGPRRPACRIRVPLALTEAGIAHRPCCGVDAQHLLEAAAR